MFLKLLAIGNSSLGSCIPLVIPSLYVLFVNFLAFSYILTLQDTPGSSSIWTLHRISHFSKEACSFYLRIELESKIRVVGTLFATEASLFLGLLN